MVLNLAVPIHDRGGQVRVNSVHFGPSWMDPIVSFIRIGILPVDKADANKIRRNTPWYWLSKESKLYKYSYSGPYLLCVHLDAVDLLLEELYEGICGGYISGRSLLSLDSFIYS